MNEQILGSENIDQNKIEKFNQWSNRVKRRRQDGGR